MSITHKELNDIKALICGFFHQRRKVLKLTQNEVSLRANIRENTVQRIEYGKFIPGGMTLLKLCESLSLQLIFEPFSPGEDFLTEMKKKWVLPEQTTDVYNHFKVVEPDWSEIFGFQIGKYFSGRRGHLQLTQQKLSDKSNLGLPTIQRIEAGKNFPDGKSLVKICYGLNAIMYPIHRPESGKIFETSFKLKT